MMDKEKLNRAAAEIAYCKVVPKARINPAAMQTVIELRKEMGVYKPPFAPPERFYDESYWTRGDVACQEKMSISGRRAIQTELRRIVLSEAAS